MAAAPVALPRAARETEDEYRRVRLTGAVAGAPIHILTSVQGEGPGYRVIAPVAAGERRVMVDLGFVPQGAKDRAVPRAEAAIEGTLLWPDETDGFTPPPDRAANIWFARDVPSMAEALGTEPLLVVATSALPGGPRPIPVTPDIPNNHRNYAITWFLLAAVWASMSVWLLLRLRRRG
ncbi:MAG: SURF1 family protein [Pseudomonadota bacterium]